MLHSSTACATCRACADEEGKHDGIEQQRYTQVTTTTTVEIDQLSEPHERGKAPLRLDGVMSVKDRITCLEIAVYSVAASSGCMGSVTST